jgi:aryl-alcohol dehydrogenase-like predicted oxidoreductase
VEYRKLGRSGVTVSAIAMGCWGIGGDWTWGAQDQEVTNATVRGALDLGVNLYDNAEGYADGGSEVALGIALKGRRHEAIIATKVSDNHLAPSDVFAACEGSLGRLQTDYIDLYQLHWPSRAVPLVETLGALDELKREGKVREVGVCNFGVGDLSDLLALEPPARAVTDQLPYGLLWRAIEDAILPRCRAAGLGVLAYTPLAQGLLTGKFRSADEVPEGRARTRHFAGSRPKSRHGEPGAEMETFEAIAAIRRICERAGLPMTQVAIAWVLAQPGVSSVLVGARRPEQIQENARAAEVKLDPGLVRELTAATEALKAKLGPNPDEYQSVSRFR